MFSFLKKRSTFFLTLVLSLVLLNSACQKKPAADEAVTSNETATPEPTPEPEPEPEPEPTPVNAIVDGDIIISNAGNDSLLLFDSAGKFKKVLYSIPTYLGDAITGITYNSTSGHILVAIDGATLDYLEQISVVTGEVVRDTPAMPFIRDAQLTGSIRGIAQLTTGDLLVVETSNIERFNAATGVRVTSAGTSGVWPKTLSVTTFSDVRSLPNGEFLICSTGTDVVRKYDANATQTATISSGIAGTTDAVGCYPTADGGVVVAWSGTTDTIRKYASDFTTVVWSYSNTTLLTTPSSLFVRASDGHVLVLDTVSHLVVELDASGNYIKFLGGENAEIDQMLFSPQFIFVFSAPVVIE